MDLKPIVGAAVGAFAGAAIWAGISIVTGYEVGYVAWGIGALVGFCAAWMGGHGQAMGVTCALLALGAIFAGKMIAMQSFLDEELATVIEADLALDDYELVQYEAQEFAKLESKAEYPQFMLTNGYTEATSVDEISAAEVEDFTLYFEDSLLSFAKNPPTYEEWRDEQAAAAAAWVEMNGSTAGLVVQNLSPIDLIFALLGIATAYQIAATGREEDNEEAAAAPTTEAEV